MAKFTAMVANGGRDIPVTIIREVRNRDGEIVDRADIDSSVAERLGRTRHERQDLDIKPEHLYAVLQGMWGATEEIGGTAHSIFRDFPIEIGGKTGSAEAGNNVNAWFVGFAPFHEPEIAIVVHVENGGRGFHTAEVVRDILEVYFGINEDILEDRMARPITGGRN